MKRIFYTLILLLLPLLACAVIPPNYYSKANGKMKAELKAALKNIIGKANVLDYGSGAGRTWTGFYTTDRYNGNQVRDRYSNEEFFFPATASEKATSAVSGMNIEHSFPKSWWGGAENQAYKDLFNLMPCEKNINSSKSNYVMGVVERAKTDNGCTKVGTGDAGGVSATLWEPADEWKGDFARNYFYMVTSYSDFNWQTEGTKMLENNHWPTLKRWAYELFLEWNRMDPVDQIEKDRNEAVYGIQGNRNPFIDYPNLAEYIWGDSIEFAFSVDGSSTEIPDITDENTFMAYEASEIVSSIYSCRFDASWQKYKEGVTYSLDVYTKDSRDNRYSLSGFPVETQETSYRVKDVKPSTMYYYQVEVLDKESVVATSNEIVVDFPPVGAVFSATPSQAIFSSMPGVASEPVKISVTMMATEEKLAYAKVEYPFEISADEEGDDWQQELTFTGSTSFFVRLSAQEEGQYNGELVLSTKGVTDRTIPLVGNVDETRSFVEDFETGNKGSYAEKTVDCTAATWTISDALIYKDKNSNDLYSLRLKNTGFAEMKSDKTNGCDSLWFYAGNFNDDKGATLTVTYSLDGGETWIPVVSNLSVDVWKRYGYSVKVQGDIRLRFEGGGVSGKRLNVDDIQMSDYKAETDIEKISVTSSDDEEVSRDSEWYDLSGRKVANQHHGNMMLRPGIYVVNGRKVVISK